MALTKAQIVIEHSGEELEVMFNPEEYTLSKDNNFASQTIPGLSGPVLQFVHGNQRTLEMELFFDTTSTRSDVRAETSKITGLLAIDSELHAPPVVRFAWGPLDLRCVLVRASQKFVKFRGSGVPVRARLNVTFNEYLDPERELREVNRQSATYSKRHVVAHGETLSELAGRYYEDPAQWRAIALANRLDDPQADLAGRALTVPPLPFVHPETGEVLR